MWEGAAPGLFPTLLCPGFIVGKPAAAFPLSQASSSFSWCLSRKIAEIPKTSEGVSVVLIHQWHKNGKEGKWGERTLGLSVWKVIPLWVRRVSGLGTDVRSEYLNKIHGGQPAGSTSRRAAAGPDLSGLEGG